MDYFAKYKIIEEIGKGGMGVVYKALDTRLNRNVAIKELLLPNDITEDSRKEIIIRFKREARTAASLDHNNIVTIFDIDVHNEKHFIAMEYIKGDSLREIIDENHKFSQIEVVELLIQIARGIEHAHIQGIVHRDIKPGNIILKENKKIKVMDFGIAYSQEDSLRVTKEGEFLGTLGYMSPEQLQSSKDVGFSTDIFSFGVVMYELFVGDLPFVGDSIGATVFKILTEPLSFPENVKFENGKIKEIIEKCLTKNPDERYQSFTEIILDLKSLSFKEIEPLDIKKACIKLLKGQKEIIDQSLNLDKLVFKFDWEKNIKGYEIEPCVMLLSRQMKLIKEGDFIFYNNKISPCKSVSLNGSIVEIDLMKIPKEISIIGFVLTIHNGEKLSQTVRDIEPIEATLVDNLENIIYSYKLEDLSQEITVIVCKIYKHNKKWKFQAVGKGYNNGLSKFLSFYLSSSINVLE